MAKRLRLILTILAIAVMVAGMLTLWGSPVASTQARPQPTSASYGYTWDVIGDGSTTMSSAHYQIVGTAGQPVIGQNATSASYRVEHGFWTGVADFFHVEVPEIFYNH